MFGDAAFILDANTSGSSNTRRRSYSTSWVIAEVEFRLRLRLLRDTSASSAASKVLEIAVLLPQPLMALRCDRR